MPADSIHNSDSQDHGRITGSEKWKNLSTILVTTSISKKDTIFYLCLVLRYLLKPFGYIEGLKTKYTGYCVTFREDIVESVEIIVLITWGLLDTCH